MSIDIKWDENANVWIAMNDELGITLEDASYDKLIDRLKIAIPEMCKLNNINVSYVYIKTATRMITCTLQKCLKEYGGRLTSIKTTELHRNKQRGRLIQPAPPNFIEKDEAKTDNKKAETTQQATTQSTTQAQATTQQNTEHQHVWVDHKKTVHHKTMNMKIELFCLPLGEKYNTKYKYMV